MFDTNLLFYGDNLEIIRKYIPDESIDLIYLDPPFNSKRAYNIIFKDKDGKYPPSQIRAFDDTWHWSEETELALDELS
ncbi:MAG: restriction endonuclease subunit M, partial [Ignavibacteria bacterium]|nr:restriction endonuclease subunit M [Ignavibacteria bacterium]